MSWPATAAELETLGQAIVADGAGAFGSYHVAFGELTLTAAHVNHGFRGAESARELETVKAYAEALGVACETITMDLPTYIEENRLNLQSAARTLERWIDAGPARHRRGRGRDHAEQREQTHRASMPFGAHDRPALIRKHTAPGGGSG